MIAVRSSEEGAVTVGPREEIVVGLDDEFTALNPIDASGCSSISLLTSDCSLTVLENMEAVVIEGLYEPALPVLYEPAPDPTESVVGQGTEEPAPQPMPGPTATKATYSDQHPLLPAPPTCSTGRCKRGCKQKISTACRDEINKTVGALEWKTRAQWYRTHVHQVEVNRRRGESDGERRQHTYKYHLPQNGVLTQVCKGFFLTAIGLHPTNDKPVRTAHEGGCAPPEDQRGRKEASHKADVGLLTSHIESHHPAAPHYRYNHAPRRRYLPSDITAASMHRDYNATHPQHQVSYERYRQQLRALNISFAVLGHEECETCARQGQHNAKEHGLSERNISDHTDGCKACDVHLEHITHAREAREEYRRDADRDLSDDELVVSADLMKVSLIPVLPHKVAVFTPRLVVFNETFSPLVKTGSKASPKALAILWHEATAGRDASDIAATYWKFLSKHREKKHITIYADNCSAQQKSWLFATSLVTYVQQPDNSTESITVKYLESGHTSMSADSSHQQIQKKLGKAKSVHDFGDFVELVNNSGVRAEIMAPTDFLELQDGVSRSKLDLLYKEGLCPKLREVRVLQARRGSELIHLKTSHGQQNFKRYDLIKSTYHPNDPVPRRQRARGINKDKIDTICRSLLPLMTGHSQLFWRQLQTQDARNISDLLG